MFFKGRAVNAKFKLGEKFPTHRYFIRLHMQSVGGCAYKSRTFLRALEPLLILAKISRYTVIRFWMLRSIDTMNSGLTQFLAPPNITFNICYHLPPLGGVCGVRGRGRGGSFL